MLDVKYLLDELRRKENAPILPFLRAFVIGYAADTVPTILRIVLSVVLRSPKNARIFHSLDALRRILAALVMGLHPQGLAVACGVAIGGARLGQPLLRPLSERVVRVARALQRPTTSGQSGDDLTDNERKHVNRLATWASSVVSSLLAITILQSAPWMKISGHPSVVLKVNPYPGVTTLSLPSAHQAPSPQPRDLALPSPERSQQSPTLDLTLFFLVRALDTGLRAMHARFLPSSLQWLGDHYGDVALFQLACWRIMFCWFYRPERLPRSYVRWISALSAMDPRLLTILRTARQGKWEYGIPTNDLEVIVASAAIAKTLGRHPDDMDVSKIAAISCEIAHGEVGASALCSVNIINRWMKAWTQAMTIYLPVFIVPTLLFQRQALKSNPLTALAHVIQGASRSSTFLATFVALVWSGVCMGRTAVLPKIYPNIPQIYWDSGFAPQLGSFLAGFSVLLENKRRRGEMALYVAPRALYALVDEIIPNALKSGAGARWGERFIFAISMSIVTTASIHHPDHVRGIVKGFMNFAVGPEWQARAAAELKGKQVPSQRA